jgi:outer membrane protein OmpA-like peptidoglycan-associated protein
MRLKLNIIAQYSALFCLLLLLAACSSTKTRVILLPEENSTSKGAVVVGEGSSATVLDTPMTAVEVGSSGRVKRENVTQEEVEKDFSAALAATPPKPISFTLYFETGSTVVLDISKETLEHLFEEVARRQAVEVQITGHTDTVGTIDDNDKLSAQRAETIKEMLISRGLQSNFIRAVGRGERELLVRTPDNVQETKNRRVEVIVR